MARYDGPGRNDQANALALDEKGNVYVTGRSPVGLDLDEQDADYATIKYNNKGKERWVKRYDGPVAGNLFDEALAITEDGSGNIYVTGSSVNSNAEDANDYATIKYDRNGNEQWTARYNGPGNSFDQALALAVDARHNVYVTGFSAGAPNLTNYDYATIRYDARGKEVWVKRYNGPANDNDLAAALALDDEGNVYVAGSSTGTGSGLDFATVKYNRAGAELWVARYNGPANGNDGTLLSFTFHPLAVDGSGNVYVTGSSAGIGSGADYTTIRYSQLPLTRDNNNVISLARETTEPADLIDELPGHFRMYNVPNPVSANTKIYYELPFDGYVSLEVYDMMGRKITSLANGARKAGSYSFNFDATALQTGVYNYRILVKTQTKVWIHTNKLSVVK